MTEHEQTPEQLRELFPLDTADGPALPLSDAAVDDLVAGALDGWQAGGDPSEAVGADVLVPRSTGLMPVALVSFALLLGGGALGYHLWGGEVTPDVERAPTALLLDESGVDMMEAPATETPGVEEPMVEAPMVEAPMVEAPADEGASEELAPEIDAALESAPRSPSVRRRRPRSAAASEDLLRRANQERGERRWREAERTYREVVSGSPRSRSAYVARLAAASLRLDKLGDARGALRLFRAARRQQPSGALDAEARRGLASAHRRLGDSRAEARELEGLVESHPDSPFARGARRRLGELSAAD